MDVSLIRKAQDFIIAFCSFQLARKNAFMYVCSVYNIAFHVLNVWKYFWRVLLSLFINQFVNFRYFNWQYVAYFRVLCNVIDDFSE